MNSLKIIEKPKVSYEIKGEDFEASSLKTQNTIYWMES